MDAELRAAVDLMRRDGCYVEKYTVNGEPTQRVSLGRHVAALTIARAYLADHPADDDKPADFEWLASIASRETNDQGDVWWEVGPVSFVCESFQADPGEPAAAVAADWQVGGETLPRMLVPSTRRDMRRLLDILRS